MSPFDPGWYTRHVANNMIVVYGSEKIGKSTLLTTLDDVVDPDPSAHPRIYLVDVDHGLEYLIQQWVRKKRPAEDVDGKLVFPTLEVAEVSDRDSFHHAVWNMPEGYDYYVIDSFTKAAKFFIQATQPESFFRTGNRRSNKAVNAKIAFYLEDYIDRVEQLAWGFKQANDAFVIVVCHEKLDTIYQTNPADPEAPPEEAIGVRPLIWGSAAAKLDRIVSFLWRVEKYKVQTPSGWGYARSFRTQGTDLIWATDRSGALQAIEPANFAKAIAKIRLKRSTKIKLNDELAIQKEN